MKCPYCGSEDIIEGVLWSAPNFPNTVGLLEKNLMFRNTHQLCSDLCKECGSLIRTYLRGYDYLKNQNISWQQEKDQNTD